MGVVYHVDGTAGSGIAPVADARSPPVSRIPWILRWKIHPVATGSAPAWYDGSENRGFVAGMASTGINPVETPGTWREHQGRGWSHEDLGYPTPPPPQSAMTRPDLPQRPGWVQPGGTIAGDVARYKNYDGAVPGAPFLARRR